MKYWEIGTQMPLYTSNQLMADNISFWKLGIKSDRHSDCNCKRMSKKLIEIYFRQLQIKDTESRRKIWRQWALCSLIVCKELTLNNNSVYFSPNEKYFSLHENYLDTRPRCRNRKLLHVRWHVFSNGQKHSFTLSITPGDVGEEKWMSCRAQILMTGNICIINPLLWHTLNTARATTTSASLLELIL